MSRVTSVLCHVSI